MGGYPVRALRLIVVAAGVLAIVLAGRSVAQDLSLDKGFRSPSGNIHCRYFGDVLRCDLKKIANEPLPRPAKCDLEFGQAFEVFAAKPLTGPICHGDTVIDDRLPVLSYGEVWKRGDFSCRSERSGVSCLNSLGAGFHLSRSAQRVIGGKAE